MDKETFITSGEVLDYRHGKINPFFFVWKKRLSIALHAESILIEDPT